MRRMLTIALLSVLPLCGGCALNDLLFDCFSDYYSAAGPGYQDKQAHYNSQIGAAQAGYDR